MSFVSGKYKMTHTQSFRRKASSFCAGVSALAVLSTMGAGQAAAQDSGYEEIIVTARRAEESLQDVPATVAVFTQSTLEMVNATTAEDVIELTPGVTIVTNTAEVGDTQINIRGINGARDGESSVALVVDGILKTNTSVLNQVQNNLQQIEILKGPQGAYYGRNAAAGALVMTTKKPGDEWEFAGEGSFGNNATVSTALTASGPITDTTGLLLSADFRETDGFFRNTGPVNEAQGATVDQYRGYTLQARLMSDLTDDISVDVKTRYADIRAGSINYNVSFQLPPLGAFNPAFNADVNDQDFTYTSNIPSDGNQETFELSAKMDWQFDGMTLTAWGLYTDVQQNLLADGAVAAFGFFNETPECIQSVANLNADGFTLPAPLAIGPTPGTSLLGAFGPTTCDGTQYQERNQEDISFEIRLASDTDAALQWSVGAYYLHLDRRVGVSVGYDRGLGIVPNLFNAQGTDNPTQQLSDDDFSTNVIALFGSADYAVTDTLDLSAALRWDREKREVSNNVPTDAFAPFARGTFAAGTAPLNIGLDANGMIPDQEATFSEIQPRVSLAWSPIENLNAFVSWGVGFKSGGFNNSGSAATIESIFNDVLNAGLNINDTFDKETSSAFEIGVKGSFLDNRIRYELAGYYTKIDDMQFFEFFAGPFGILRVVSNIDEVEIIGVEGSINATLSEGINIFGGFNINDSEIKANNARPGTVGGESPYTADYTINAGIDIVQPVSDSLDLTMRLDYRRVGPTWFHTAQTGTRPSLFGPADYTNSERDPFDVINLRGGIQSENWSVIAFVENLANSEYLDEVIPAPEFGGAFTSPGGRRYYGVQARFNF